MWWLLAIVCVVSTAIVVGSEVNWRYTIALMFRSAGRWDGDTVALIVGAVGLMAVFAVALLA